MEKIMDNYKVDRISTETFSDLIESLKDTIKGANVAIVHLNDNVQSKVNSISNDIEKILNSKTAKKKSLRL